MPETIEDQALNDKVLETVRIEVNVCVGQVRPTMAELSKLKVQDILSLKTALEDPVSLYVGKRIIAEGVLEELTEGAQSGEIGVRITRIVRQQGD